MHKLFIFLKVHMSIFFSARTHHQPFLRGRMPKLNSNHSRNTVSSPNPRGFLAPTC